MSSLFKFIRTPFSILNPALRDWGFKGEPFGTRDGSLRSRDVIRPYRAYVFTPKKKKVNDQLI